ncbi:MAG: ribosome small subunit-dependent GTPase A [Candidatus Izemoplasmatales bacterium]
MNLQIPGWTEQVARAAAAYSELSAARVSGQERDLYTIISEQGTLPAKVSGKMIHQSAGPADFPAVGDWVAVDVKDGFAVIQAILPRKSVLERKSAGMTSAGQIIASNVDVVFICMSTNENYNLRRLERYLAVVWASGAEPCVVLTKTDLADDVASAVAEVMAVAPGVEILTATDRTGEGYADIDRRMRPGRTCAFVGSSGVGKSTIVNHLMDTAVMATQDVGKDDKGHHTTTSRQLFVTPAGAIVIDTPGMRELQIDVADFDSAFADIEELAASCRFGDCTHESEPHCAVKAAIADGRLPAERMENYRKMQREAAHQERKAKTAEIAAARWRRTH